MLHSADLALGSDILIEQCFHLYDATRFQKMMCLQNIISIARRQRDTFIGGDFF